VPVVNENHTTDFFMCILLCDYSEPPEDCLLAAILSVLS
jgi:hypothetical protein